MVCGALGRSVNDCRPISEATHALTHPEWWQIEAMSRGSACSAVLTGVPRSVTAITTYCLKRPPRPQRSKVMSEPGLSYLVAGHQPNFFPWFGYFEKMLKCDLFVHSDDVQFPKQSYTNRVEIPIGGRSAFMTLPVRKGDNARIADKRYLKDPAVMSKLVKTLRINFGGLPNFSDVEPVIAEFESAWALHETVADFNICLNQYLASSFGICTPCRRGTELGLDEFYRNERLIERCRRLASHDYLCGQGADGYQDDTMLEEQESGTPELIMMSEGFYSVMLFATRLSMAGTSRSCENPCCGR